MARRACPKDEPVVLLVPASASGGPSRVSAREWFRDSLRDSGGGSSPPGVPAYLVGGCLRDRLLGRPIRDVDVATAADPRGLGQLVAARAGGACVVLDADPVLVRIAGPEGRHLDISGLRGGGILADLAERDFTINALGAPLEPRIGGVAPCGGLPVRAGRAA